MNAELAALLRAAKETPEDDAPRLVIADWLDEHGEPARAELLRVQCHADYRWHGTGAALRTRAIELIAEHGERWWGSDIPSGYLNVRRGLLEVNLRLDLLIRDNPPSAIRDACLQGWVEGLTIRDVHGRWQDLGDCSCLANVTHLTLDDIDFDDAAAAVLVASPHLGSLVSLNCGHCSLTPAGELLFLDTPNLPRLTRFEAGSASLMLADALRDLESSGVLRFGLYESPTILQTLRGITRPVPEVRAANADLTADVLHHLLALPGLQRLFISHNTLHREEAQVIAEHAPLTLTHLDLSHSQLDTDAVLALAGSPRLAGLRLLDLAGNGVLVRGVTALARSPHLADLQALDLRNSRLSPKGVKILSEADTFPQMRRLILNGGSLSTEQIAALTERYGDRLTWERATSLSTITLPGDAS